MLLINLRALMERKAAIDGKRLTYKEIEKHTGISAVRLSRIATNHLYNISRKDIERLLLYFGCYPNDLFTLIKEKKRK